MVPHAPNRVIPEHGVKILIAEHQEYQECDTNTKQRNKEVYHKNVQGNHNFLIN